MTRRLLLGFLAFAFVVLALLVIPLGIVNQRSERTDLTRRLERDAVAAASLSIDALRSGTAADAATLRTRLAGYADKDGARVVVVDGNGTSVIDTGEAGRTVRLGRDFSSRAEVRAALAGRVDSGERGSDTLGHDLLFVAVPVTSGGRALGAVRISYPSQELEDRVQRYWLGLAAVSFAVLAVAALVGIVVARWIARPLEAIASVADDVGRGDLAARADEDGGPAEVRAVATRLNASVAAIERTLQAQREFTADASHQLRTPLHALTLRLDNVAHGLASGDVATASSDVERAAADLERLAALVESLLVLERADRSSAEPAPATDLSAVVAGRARAWGERAERAGVRFEVDVPAGLVARARALHVEQVLDNYIDNALALTPEGRSVRVIGARDGDGVELHVVDEGPGLPEDQLEAVFRRFHSTSERPRSAGVGGGFGLGLSIVRRLAEVDGGRAWLRRGPGRGLDAVVRYTAAADGP
ncbi:MAG: signal transduction histidine kinase [Thermoleophilia bacterium]|nr:signal transduction histidine kinase [Thermoleophilia bacterium]